MIICLIGGVGTGKTLSVVREIMNNSNLPMTNFRLKQNIKHHRLKYSDIINFEYDKKNNPVMKSVNWEFWETVRRNVKDFSIYLDEAHNIIHSRASMTKRNILMSQWISQIRKVLSDSPTNHIYIITQTPRKIDVNFRELTHVVISCEKKIIRGDVYIIQRYYDGFEGFENRKVKSKSYFVGNKYFNLYNSTDMVRFTDAEEFI